MKISIITVSYNSEKTIRDTLQSVANQTYDNIEHLIVDGNSNDNTLKIVEEFPHITNILSEPDNGIYDAMNKGILRATGEVIGILNSDDIFASSNIIAEIAKVFQEGVALDTLYGNIEYFEHGQVDKIVRYWRTKSYYSRFFEDGEVPPHPALFVKKKVYDEIGLYYPHFKICSDYEFMFRMLKISGYKSKFLDKSIVKMRMGGVSTRGIRSYITTTKELKECWQMNGYNYPISLYVRRPIIKLRQLINK